MDFAQQVKSAVNIVSVVGDHVRLKKQGANRYLGLCPFHTEKTPSFNVNEGLQIYKCFGCGKGGDVFSFLMEIQGLSFFEALKALADQHSIPLPKRASGDLSDADTRLRAALYRMHEIAQRVFEEQLRGPAGAAARGYLESRGVSAETQARFGLGYAAGGARLVSLFEKEGIPRDQVDASGLVATSQDGSRRYDRFRDRLMFPIHNESGKVIAFAGRVLDSEQQPKYLNSPETPIYKKSSVLYNLNRAKETMRRDNRVVLVEGYMDVIGLDRAGVSNSVASCGTALTAQQARMMRRPVDTVVINFDPDQAGQGAAERSIEMLLQVGLNVKVLTLPEGLDPDEYCSRHGGERYQALLESAPDYFIWLADRARRKYDLRTSEGRVAAFQFLLPSINLLGDKIRRVSLANELAEHLGIERGLVLEQFRRSASERRSASVAVPPEETFSPGERLLLALLIASEEGRRELLGGALEIAAEDELPSRPILEALRAVESQGDPFHYTALEGRLEEGQREVLSKIAFDPDNRWSLEDGREALAALRRQSWERRYRSVRRQIAEAEKSGDHPRALDLLREKKELENHGRRMGFFQQTAGAAGLS